ncbi:phage tail tape measure protein [Solibacillus sp.]|uniref:phage tail tape measure protein n=1 Tax=Solibacillus sp. TaxID=1909654 RepID=UPI003314A115
MSRTFETTVEINGAIGSSFTNAFRSAQAGMTDLRQEARAVQRELDRLGTDFRNGRIHQSQYTEETRRLTGELDTLESRQRRFTAFKDTVTKDWNTTKAIASIAAIGAATAAVATTFDAINLASDFESQLSKVQAKTQGTDQEMSALRQTALELGASTSLSASETALAMDELAAKGFDAGKIIGAMPGIIAGAEASGEDLALVSDVVTSAINSYGFAAEDAGKISDIMAMSANKTAAGVSDLGQSFKYAAPVAKTLGIKFEELTAATGILVDKGLAGEQAGTALRMSLIRLSKPPTEAAKALKNLNISAVDSNKNFKSLAQISGEWNKATEKLSATQKVQYASTVFGSEAATAMLNIFDAGPEKIQEMTKALEESAGSAAEAAAIMKNNFAGAKEQMFGAVESAKIAFATPILPVMQDAMNAIAAIVENNMGTIENMGNSVAQVFANITAPFAMTEPVQPKIEPHFDPDYATAAMEKYQSDMAKYELFQGMDTGEKVSYMLDETVSTIEGWLGGSGASAMQRIFTEVGTIAGKAWLTAFTTTAKGAVGELMEGNFAGALAMGAAANSLSGGLLLSGGLAAGKWALGKGRSIAGRGNQSTGGSAASTVVPATSNAGSRQARNATASGGNASASVVTPSNNRTRRSNNATPATSPNSIVSPPRTSNRLLSGVGKVAGKAALPITALTSVASIMTADNKAEATGGAIGSIAGGLGGAKIGAAIGTVIAPGIGTAIGGAIGGLAGSIGGSFFGSKAGNAVAPKQSAPSVIAEAPVANASNSASATNQSFTTLNSNVTALGSYFGTATTDTQMTFTALQTETAKLSNNMLILASYIGQASGWIVSLQGIQPAAQRVISSLNMLEQRINATELPGQTSRRTSYE